MELKVNSVENVKSTNINDYDVKDIITKQGVDKGFTNKVNRDLKYKRKMGQTTRRHNQEVLERLKESYKNYENERIFDFSPDFEMTKFSPEDFANIVDFDISDLLESNAGEQDTKIKEIHQTLLNLYKKNNIQKEIPKDLNGLLEYFQSLQNQGKTVIEEQQKKLATSAAENIKVLKVEDLKEPEKVVEEVLQIEPKDYGNDPDLD